MVCEDKTWVLGFSSAAGGQPILKLDTQIFICAQDIDEAVSLDGNSSRSRTPASANPFLIVQVIVAIFSSVSA